MEIRKLCSVLICRQMTSSGIATSVGVGSYIRQDCEIITINKIWIDLIYITENKHFVQQVDNSYPNAQ